MNKHNKNNKRQKLQLAKETLVCLSEELLKHVVGGDAIDSIPISSCPTHCPGSP